VNVLLIEADGVCGPALAAALEGHGVRVRVCECFLVVAGLSMAPPDAVLACSPGRDCPAVADVLRQLRDRPGWGGVRLALLTAAAGKVFANAQKLCAEMNMPCLRKPATVGEILSALGAGVSA
jgi:DNA-binding response OmpR family regulator